jgi:hypothetical protein
MPVTCGLLFAVGVLGAADIVLFHSLSHGIRSHRDSRWELWLHALRGPTYATLFLVLPNFDLAGGWLAALFALYAVDLAVSLADFCLEEHSRERLGGLPTGEYVLHILIAMLFGAMATATAFESGGRLWTTSAIAYRPCVPAVLQAAFAAMAASVTVSGIMDARAARRLSRIREASER